MGKNYPRPPRSREQMLARAIATKEKGNTGKPFTRGHLIHARERRKKSEYPEPKWIMFCETMLDEGMTLSIYESKTTVSKYIWVSRGQLTVKVRFSNHRPNNVMQQVEDCDYYVGVSNGKVITTEQVIEKILSQFGRM